MSALANQMAGNWWKAALLNQVLAQTESIEQTRKRMGLPKERFHGPTKNLDARLLALGGAITWRTA